jgi:hypothetical protein
VRYAFVAHTQHPTSGDPSTLVLEMVPGMGGQQGPGHCRLPAPTCCGCRRDLQVCTPPLQHGG